MGRGKSEVTKLREETLRRRGLLRKGYGKLVRGDAEGGAPVDVVESIHGSTLPEDREGKTILMLTLERLFNTDIDSLLDTSRPIKEVGEKLGINESTVSKWRLMRGLRSKQVTYVLE